MEKPQFKACISVFFQGEEEFNGYVRAGAVWRITGAIHFEIQPRLFIGIPTACICFFWLLLSHKNFSSRQHIESRSCLLFVSTWNTVHSTAHTGSRLPWASPSVILARPTEINFIKSVATLHTFARSSIVYGSRGVSLQGRWHMCNDFSCVRVCDPRKLKRNEKYMCSATTIFHSNKSIQSRRSRIRLKRGSRRIIIAASMANILWRAKQWTHRCGRV